MSVDSAELPAPFGVVEERTVVEAVVVGTVRLSMNGRRDYRHLVSVDGVATVEMLHLVGPKGEKAS